MDYLDNDIKFVGGVGEARARLLDKELGIRTLGDMLRHYPFRYIDRTKVYRIAEITDDAPTLLQFRARVTGVAYAGTGRKRRFTAYVSDPTGSAELVWFQGIKWIEKRVEVGREYLIFGRPSFYRGELSMAHPELETMEQALSRKAESGMQGIYPSTEKLSNVLGAKGMYQIICNAWALAKDHIPDYMPDEVRTRYGLIPLRDAYYNIHFPQSPELLRQAQYRLKFDELLGIQLNIQSRRTERLARNNGFLFMKVGGVFNTFYNEKLPFPLTGAQKRVIREIRQDTVTGYQMNRLLQGDVGSGKTLVAAAAIWACIRAGYQAALLAPTEILAAQHAEGLNRLLAPFGMRVALLTGGMKAAARRTTLAAYVSVMPSVSDAATLEEVTDYTTANVTGVVKAPDGGIAIKAEEKGFDGGILTVIMGFDANGAETGIWVDASTQTKGIGSNVSTDDFLAQFNGMDGTKNIVMNQDFDAYSGATISSTALFAAINDCINCFNELA